MTFDDPTDPGPGSLDTGIERERDLSWEDAERDSEMAPREDRDLSNDALPEADTTGRTSRTARTARSSRGTRPVRRDPSTPTREDTTVVDLATRTVMRVRVPWPEDHDPDIATFDVVEVTLAPDPERDDLAQPEATTVADLPRHVGTLRGRQLRKLLARMVASPDGPLLGFPGPSAPYWEFRGFRPSVALIEPTRSPQLIRRQADGTTWVRSTRRGANG
jgi:hypothetical protein